MISKDLNVGRLFIEQNKDIRDHYQTYFGAIDSQNLE
jgi:hypothetical protein